MYEVTGLLVILCHSYIEPSVLLVDGHLVLLKADEHLLRLLLVLGLVLHRRRLLRGRNLVILGQLLVPRKGSKIVLTKAVRLRGIV